MPIYPNVLQHSLRKKINLVTQLTLNPLLVMKKQLQRRYYRLWWQQKHSITGHCHHFNELYAPINGFVLSQHARAQNDALQYIYGEINFYSFIQLLSTFPISANTVFYDLGSGIGKAVLAFAMVFRPKSSIGIECLAPLHIAACAQKQRALTLPIYRDLADKIIFQSGSFLDYDLTNATLIFINGSTFIGELWQKTSHHLNNLKPGTWVLSTSKPIDSSQFNVIRTTHLLLSFGFVTVYCQIRR